jgi:hypothetical protein
MKIILYKDGRRIGHVEASFIVIPAEGEKGADVRLEHNFRNHLVARPDTPGDTLGYVPISTDMVAIVPIDCWWLRSNGNV